ncbi:MAG: PadR family transcriptional regulator [Gemmatimonadota bacterium]
MPLRPDSSPQTRAVLAALHGHPAQWRYGYDIARETSLASGTLYPILGRLADRGYLETRWEADPPAGRPRRHLYRLTAAGAARAAGLQREAAARATRRRPSARPATGPAAPERA